MIFSTKQPRGFTLVETVLYVSIACLLLLAISFFLSNMLQTRAKSVAIAEVEGQGVQVMQLMTQTVRNAALLNTPAASTSSTMLSVNTTSTTTSPTVFSLSGGVLQMKEGTTTATIPLTNGKVAASNLSFTNFGTASTSGSVRMQFTLTMTNFATTSGFSYTKTFIGTATVR